MSPVLFLVWMAPILTEMEKRVVHQGEVRVEFPTYVDDLHCGLYDTSAETRAQEEVLKGECMEELIRRAGMVVKEVAAEYDLPLGADKEESIVLRERRRRGRRGFGKKVKWLGFIFDESLSFEPHWKARIEKAKYLVGALRGVGGSRWGMSSYSWRAAYTGMVRGVVS